MRKTISNWSLCMLFVVAWLHSYGQQGLNFTSLTTKNGLSSNIVNAVLKDSYGWVWFATADGLNRFDGTNFTVYRHRDGDKSSLPVNEILSLYEDKTGKLWIGTGGGALVFYDRIHDTFQQYSEGPVWKKLQTQPILAIAGDHLNRLWVSGFGGIYIVDLKTNTTTTPNFIRSKFSPLALGFFEDSKHRMWAGTSAGLFCFNLDNGAVTQYIHNDEDKKSIGPGIIKGIAEDNSGRVWFGTRSGLSVLQPDGKGFINFKTGLVHVIAPDKGNLWLGTDSGLVIFNTRNLKSERYLPMPRNNYSLSARSISSIYIDQSNIYWIGTTKGVNKFDRNLALLDVKQYNPFDPQGLLGPNINAFAELANGNIFIGTDNGLQLFDRNSGLFKTVPIAAGETRPGDPITILCLKLDKTGRLWIGTWQQGLYILDPRSGKCEHILKGNIGKNISQNSIYCIEEDQLGRMWLGTNGYGIDIYDPKTKLFNNYHQLFGGSSLHGPTINNFIRTITPINNDEVWVGTWGGGITVFNINTGGIMVYNKAANKLPNDLILSVLQDETGNIWVATNGGGIDQFDAKSARFDPYVENEGIINDIVYKILQDKSGLLWLSTSRGIVKLDLRTAKTNIYGKQNGVQNSPFIRGAGLETREGILFFGGQDGFNYFNPQQLPQNNEVPKLVLTDLKVDNLPVSAGKNSPIHEQISIAKEIDLAYHQNFSISYSALNYTDARQDQYSYMLKGFDKKWNYVGHASTAYFTNLDPGSYTFLVRVSNSHGLWNAKPTSILINVSPPWWRTIYAYIIYILSIAGVLLYIRHRGIKDIKMKLAIEEEKRETQRMHELDVMKINFLTNLSHEFRTPISLIMAPIEVLTSFPTEENISRELSVIKRNARRLLNLVNQLLDFRKMEEQELRLNLYRGDLVEFIKDAADSFRDISERKKINFLFETTVESLQTRFDRDKIERIIFNLLSNAFKFTSSGGTIHVKLSIIDHHGINSLQILITDTGIGIPECDQTKIFEKFYQHDTPDIILNQGSGIGLSIVKEFAQLHGGDVSVSSEPGQGSSFIVILPILDIAEQAIPVKEDLGDNNNKPADTIKVSDTEKYNVLLVEDNDDFRNYLKQNLEATYKVTEAANGKEGWQKVLATHPDLVISDVSMPIMDGIELCKKIKTDKRTSFIPVILLTALGREEDQIKGLQTEANDYLTKPFSLKILNTRINNLINLNQHLRKTFSKQIQMIMPEAEGVRSTNEKLLNDIAIFIEDRLNDSTFSIEDLSKHLNMSRSSLYNKLFELTGQPPVDYVREIKLKKAASLLENSNYTIREIAFMTGFATPGYFSKLFKEKYNLSPSEFLSLKRTKIK